MAAGHWQQRGRQDNGCDQAKPSSLLASGNNGTKLALHPLWVADRAADAVRAAIAHRFEPLQRQSRLNSD
jgi:hypothetical protein